MGDFRVAAARALVMLAATAGALATGLGECPVYPQLPNFDITKVSTCLSIRF